MNGMEGKVALVTGATGGIGRITARELAKAGADLTIVARSKDKAAETLAEINAAAPNAKVDVIYADLSEIAQVRAAAAEFKKKHDRLHLLVNNAGAVNMERHVTKDGFELTFAVNHLAYFVLTNELLDLLKASAPARIVSVASDGHRIGKIDFDDLQGEKAFGGMKAYTQSKLANILWSNELARRLQGTGVTSNSVHPGVVATGFGRNSPGFFNFLVKLGSIFMITPEKGARTTLHVATSPDVGNTTGAYWAKRKPSRPAKQALDEAVGKRLWEVSEQLVAGK
ncbi:MAG: SDR family oxidoreductase [Myxococcaceae bacterium]